MSHFKNIKRTLTHLVCMIMLVLIQFDVCGYDLMRACQLADKPMPEYAASADVCLDENDGNVSAWANPVYRGFSLRSFIKAPLIEFASFIFHSFQRELVSFQYFAHLFQAKLLNMTYLRFCVFLI